MPCVYLPGPAPAVTVTNNYHELGVARGEVNSHWKVAREWTRGSSEFDKIFDNCSASCSFRLAKDIYDDFKKVFFFNLQRFYVFLVFLMKNFGKWPSCEVHTFHKK
jgi:hypothetical protein